LRTVSAAVQAARGSAVESPTYSSATEMREVLEKLLTDIDGDPEVGCSLHEAGTAYRLRCPDIDFVVNVAPDPAGDRGLRWAFSDEIDWEPGLAMETDAATANRVLQGRENLAIAIARGKIDVSCDLRAALHFFELTRPVVHRYRDLVASEYPHLLVVRRRAGARKRPARSAGAASC
jgi:hypothetical protein